ncbi:fatty acid-binding protein, muscle-like [Contarinia nasturtii]|uniref:fatty acid-binding protein, muscle-like n=1 Tax=Contarinia nasturtii TaxID=265458 RepID=UPI0012D3BF8C|nr:fatty acid-binding protein, muscle-like [Contarinia nasturtii]
MKFIITLIAVCVAIAAAGEIWEGKVYKNYESVNFNDYMKELGVGWFLRSVGNSVSPTVELRKMDGNKYKLITKSTFKDTELNFELGKEFDEVTLDGRNVKSVMTLENNVLTQKQGGDPPSTIIRVFGEKEMVATMLVKDVNCTRKYKVEE